MRTSIAFIALCLVTLLTYANAIHSVNDAAPNRLTPAYTDAELYALIASDLAHDDATGRAAYQEDLDRIWLQIEANPEASLRDVAAAVFCSLRYGVCSPNAITQRLEIWIQRDPLNAYPVILAGITRNQALDYDGAIAYFNRIEPAMFCDDYLGEIVHHYLREGVHEITPSRMKIDSLDRAIWPCLKSIQNYIISGTRGAIIRNGQHTSHGLQTMFAETILFRSMIDHELPQYRRHSLRYWKFEFHQPITREGRYSVAGSILAQSFSSPREYTDDHTMDDEISMENAIRLFGNLETAALNQAYEQIGEPLDDIRWFNTPVLMSFWLNHLDATTQPPGEVGDRPVIDKWLCQSSPNKPHGRRPSPDTPRKPPTDIPSD